MIWLRLSLMMSGHFLTLTTGLITINSQLFCLNPEVQQDQILSSVGVLESFPVKSLAECAFWCLQHQQECIAFTTQHSGTGASDTQECQLGKKKQITESDITFDKSFKYYEICSLDSIPSYMMVTSGSGSIPSGASRTTQLLSTTRIDTSSGSPTTTVTYSLTKKSSTSSATVESSTSPATTTTVHFVTSTEYAAAATTQKVAYDQLKGVDAAATMYMKVPQEQSEWTVTHLLFYTNKIYAYRNSTFNDQPYILSWIDIAPTVTPEPSGVKAIITSGNNYHMSVLTNDDKIIKLGSKYEGGFQDDSFYGTVPSSQCLLTSDVQASIDHDDDLNTCIYIKQDAENQMVYARGYNVDPLSQVVQEIINNNPGSPVTASITIGPIYNIGQILLFMGTRYIALVKSEQTWIKAGENHV
ncbi:uncharacterized protein LOC111089401 [Limulus polyphemus]|uniref:Uncharacterized protein LOC111089401 n=1 Tax=Limulus polyphemus TaxID=6850 RepID=A0ABM1TNT8_LIMPO|nr:uncharacterized protein LOC111089401 [Limulus polyphemus]